MDTTIITAITSLVISLLSLFVSLRSQRLQNQQFDKAQRRSLTARLYEHRLTHYPGAFAATDAIVKQKGNCLNPSEMQRILRSLTEWKTGTVSLVMSQASIGRYYDLMEALSRAPAFGTHYSVQQTGKLWYCRNRFRRSLRRDMGLLYAEEEDAMETRGPDNSISEV